MQRSAAISYPLVVAFLLAAGAAPATAEPVEPIPFETQYLKCLVGANGAALAFIDKRSGTDYCLHSPGAKFAHVTKGGKAFPATQAELAGRKLTVKFGDSGVTATLAVEVNAHYFTLETLSVSGDNVNELAFFDMPLKCRGTLEDEFQACALALNLKSHVLPLPGPTAHLEATCFGRSGLTGAKVAILGSPRGELRNVMKEAVTAAKDLPHSPLSGPWALDAESNRGSYLIDYPGSISETNVDKWITTARAVGARQIDFHTGHTLRFGDYEPDRAIYPQGLGSMKQVIDKLHAAGLAAGLHTYAFFVAKDCKWVSPVPDPRLGKDAAFTLASPLTETNTTITVQESTKAMSTLTGFQVRNSVTVQVDDELITYSGINKEPPYAFTGCQRGACGTRAGRHAAGVPVQHLRECFGLFTPDGDSNLFEEVAARTAEVYNFCGFDMIYLDALDGADVLGHWPNGPQYYHTRFVYALCQGLKRPAIMEMSTFDHALWFARSRIGAWDASSKAYKRLIDRHVLANQTSREMFMPANLGWWCVFDWTPKDRIRTFPDDVEYLMCKALAGDYSLSWLMGFEPDTYAKSYNCQRLATLVKQYEELRLANYFPQSVRNQLAAPGRDFALEQAAGGRWQFRPVRYDEHTVSGLDGRTGNRWQFQNPFGKQRVRVRIEALLSLAPYEADGEVAAAFTDAGEFNLRQSSGGTTGTLFSVASPAKAGGHSGCLAARTEQANRRTAWTMAGKTFAQPVSLLERGFGVWVHGDGKGEVLNFQWRAPEHLSSGVSEHYATIDFTGWRYFEFVEPESDRLLDYGWPYFYTNPDREFSGTNGWEHWNLSPGTFWVDYARLDSLKLWYNNLPKGEEVRCLLSPVKILPHVKARLVNPSVEVGGRTIVFPVELESGSYLEFRSWEDCKVYDAKGAFVRDVTPKGESPLATAGANTVRFNCRVTGATTPRANVTIITQGDHPVGAP